MLEAQRKILMYDLNLEYPIPGYSIEAHTNWLINRQMNEFEYLYAEAPERIFILDYKDDILSLICYRMLKNLQAICKFNFQILIMGKTWHTRRYLKNQKKISHLRAEYYWKTKDKCVIVQPINPLYNVLNLKPNYKNFPCKTWTPIIAFTPEQLRMCQIFYHIGFLKKDKIQLDSTEINTFTEFLKGNNNEWCKDLPFKYKGPFAMVKLTNKVDEDILLLQEVEDYNGLVFYFFDEKETPQILSSPDFALCVKNKANIPGDNNINNLDIPYFIHDNFYAKIDFIGNWDYDKRKYEILGEI